MKLFEVAKKVAYEVTKVYGMTVGMMRYSKRIASSGRGSFLKTQKIKAADVKRITIRNRDGEVTRFETAAEIEPFLKLADSAKERALALVRTPYSLTIELQDGGMKSFGMSERHLRPERASASEIALTWELRGSENFEPFLAKKV